MLSLLNITIGILWFLSATIDYAGLCYVWQLKWYRLDKFKDFISTEQGKRFIYRYDILWRTLMALFIFFWPINSVLLLKEIIIAFFIIDLSYGFYRVLKHKARRPVPTPKALLIIFLSMVLEASWIILTRDWAILLLALIMHFFIIGIVVYIVHKFTWVVKQILIIKAKHKLVGYPNLIVIGITGSYGKTTVKEFLSQILSAKFKVIKTPKYLNSHIGILKFILKTDFNNTDIFVAEVAADKKGDITLICDVIKPKIGILTAINEQHLSIFGSIKNTQSTKYELLRSLPKDGLAVVNSDNKYCCEYLQELDTTVKTFGTEEKYKPNYLIDDVHNTKEGIECHGSYLHDKQVIKSVIRPKVHGEYQAMNIAPCIIVGSFLGMKDEEIISAANKLKNLEQGLQIYNYGKTTIIDDSHNSNPDGFKVALQVLNSRSSGKRRIVVTRGMMELADESDELHEIIAGEIAFVADELVIITPDFIEPLRAGAMSDKYHLEIKIKTNPEKLLEYIKSLKNKDFVILLENRLPLLVYNEISKEKINTKGCIL